MRTERKELPKFAPITIILETEEEALIMRAALNASVFSLKESGGRWLWHISDIDKVQRPMWQSYNEVFNPG